jgi:hypothetical protein
MKNDVIVLALVALIVFGITVFIFDRAREYVREEEINTLSARTMKHNASRETRCHSEWLRLVHHALLASFPQHHFSSFQATDRDRLQNDASNSQEFSCLKLTFVFRFANLYRFSDRIRRCTRQSEPYTRLVGKQRMQEYQQGAGIVDRNKRKQLVHGCEEKSDRWKKEIGSCRVNAVCTTFFAVWWWLKRFLCIPAISVCVRFRWSMLQVLSDFVFGLLLWIKDKCRWLVSNQA